MTGSAAQRPSGPPGTRPAPRARPPVRGCDRMSVRARLAQPSPPPGPGAITAVHARRAAREEAARRAGRRQCAVPAFAHWRISPAVGGSPMRCGRRPCLSVGVCLPGNGRPLMTLSPLAVSCSTRSPATVTSSSWRASLQLCTRGTTLPRRGIPRHCCGRAGLVRGQPG
jgi:hypothetical protein